MRARAAPTPAPGSPSPRANVLRRLRPEEAGRLEPGSCQMSTNRSACRGSSIVQSAPSCQPSVRPIASSAFGVASASERDSTSVTASAFWASRWSFVRSPLARSAAIQTATPAPIASASSRVRCSPSRKMSFQSRRRTPSATA